MHVYARKKPVHAGGDAQAPLADAQTASVLPFQVPYQLRTASDWPCWNQDLAAADIDDWRNSVSRLLGIGPLRLRPPAEGQDELA
jgi:hypothetical protein